MQKMKKITIANQKGGVGKTATVVNLGSALAQRGYRVLLIDGDPQSNVTESVGAEVGEKAGLYELLMDDETSASDVIMVTTFENLDLIPSNIGLSGVEVELATARGRNTRLSKKLHGELN